MILLGSFFLFKQRKTSDLIAGRVGLLKLVFELVFDQNIEK